MPGIVRPTTPAAILAPPTIATVAPVIPPPGIALPQALTRPPALIQPIPGQPVIIPPPAVVAPTVVGAPVVSIKLSNMKHIKKYFVLDTFSFIAFSDSKLLLSRTAKYDDLKIQGALAVK